jgi:tRNA-binding protein
MTPATIKPEITLDDLAKIDVRVGTIVSVHDIAESRTLVRLVVDIGSEQRSVLAGLKRERADVRAIEGRQALFVVNLPPKSMAGHVSEAMLFDIGYADKITPVLAVPEAPVPNGARAG